MVYRILTVKLINQNTLGKYGIAYTYSETHVSEYIEKIWYTIYNSNGNIFENLEIIWFAEYL